MFKIGVDVGGTFTDFVIYDGTRKKIDVLKIPSEKNTPWLPIIEALKKEIKDSNKISDIRHGTTIGINAVIERKGSKTALLTTAGFRDLLEIARQKRPHLYNLHMRKPPPLIPRCLRIPITERIGRDGRVIIPLSEKDILDSVDKFKEEKIESVAVLFLHSYASSINEKKAENIIKKNLPQVYISVSSDVIPEFREYERLATTVLNAYIGPVFKKYLEKLLSGLKKINIKAPLYLCQSDGGMISPESIKDLPVRTLFSGPAAGVTGASFLYGHSGDSRASKDTGLVILDMGGTSADTAIISESKPVKTTEKEVMGYPVRFPAIDVATIGAGGGSIADVDEGGFLKVGPESSGADPGPACYGKGGEKPTVTDANLVLGTLGEKTMLGGRMKLNLEKAEGAIKNQVSVPLKISLIEGARAIIRIIISDISEAIRKISISKGFHPRDLKLVAYGGAGPMHAALIAKELGISEVIIPRNPGAFSAEGLLYSNITIDFARTVKGAGKDDFYKNILDFKKRAENWFKKENITRSRQKLEWSLDVRYAGQNYEITVPVREKDIAGREGCNTDRIRAIFSKKHRDIYGFSLKDKEMEIVNLRLRCIGIISVKSNGKITREEPGSGSPVSETRKVYYMEGREPVKTPVYKRDFIRCGSRIKGPAIIEQIDSTTVIPPGCSGRLREDGSLIINMK